MRYAIQHKITGVLVDLCDTLDQATAWKGKDFDIVDTQNASHIEVRYVECSGPNGYGCNIPEFETYGGIIRCLKSLTKWMQGSCRTFGPDYREVKDYFHHCHFYINGDDKSEWFWSYININKKIFI